jgi:hypothetical protein
VTCRLNPEGRVVAFRSNRGIFGGKGYLQTGLRDLIYG